MNVFSQNCVLNTIKMITKRFNYFEEPNMPFKASRGAGAQSVPVNRLVVGSIPTRGDEIFIYIYIFISSLWSRGENAALSSAI